MVILHFSIVTESESDFEAINLRLAILFLQKRTAGCSIPDTCAALF